MYINSENIKIYPVSSRKENNAQGNISNYGQLGRLTTEDNLTSNYTKITDFNNFIINGLNINLGRNNVIINPGKVCIDGYIFDITRGLSLDITNYLTTGFYVYLTITKEIKNILTNLNIQELESTDIDNKYQGLSINISESQPQETIESADKIIKNFIIAHYTYSDNLVEDTTLTPRSKFSMNNMRIDLSKDIYNTVTKDHNSALTNINDWLLNNFIIDDGDIA